jgi:hypothetical protein
MNTQGKEDTETQSHPNNFNRDNGFMLIQAWYPIVSLLHEANKLKQHWDETQLKKTKAELSNIDTKY